MTTNTLSPATRLRRIVSAAIEARQAQIMAGAAQTEDAAVALWSLHGEKVAGLLDLITPEGAQADLKELEIVAVLAADIGMAMARPFPAAAVEVCYECDIANCRHIRERRAQAAARPMLNLATGQTQVDYLGEPS